MTIIRTLVCNPRLVTQRTSDDETNEGDQYFAENNPTEMNFLGK